MPVRKQICWDLSAGGQAGTAATWPPSQESRTGAPSVGRERGTSSNVGGGEGVPAGGEEIGSVGFWTCKRTDVTEVTKMARPEENLRRHLSLKESKSVKRKVSYTTCTNSLLILYKILFCNINI